MKKLKIIILNLFVLFVFGCARQQSLQSLLPYIEPITQKQDIISVAQTYSLKFFVVNPTINTFVGNLTYKYDANCLNIMNGGNVDNVEVRPKNKRAFTKDFTFRYIDQHGRLIDQYGREIETSECLQKPLQLAVYLYDKGGDFRGSADFILTVTQ